MRLFIASLFVAAVAYCGSTPAYAADPPKAAVVTPAPAPAVPPAIAAPAPPTPPIQLRWVCDTRAPVCCPTWTQGGKAEFLPCIEVSAATAKALRADTTPKAKGAK